MPPHVAIPQSIELADAPSRDEWAEALAAHAAALRSAASAADAQRHAAAISLLVEQALAQFGEAADEANQTPSDGVPIEDWEAAALVRVQSIGDAAGNTTIDRSLITDLDDQQATPSIWQRTRSEPDSRQPIADSFFTNAESLLFVAAEPLDGGALAQALGLSAAEWAARLPAFHRHFAGRGIRLQEVEGRFQLVSAPEAGPLLEQFFGSQAATRLSSAALEVLAIIAYRQPLTRAQVEAIRGVDSSGVLRALLTRELIQEIGRAEAPGRPILYATTPQFLQQFGLERLADLPEIEIPAPPD